MKHIWLALFLLLPACSQEPDIAPVGPDAWDDWADAVTSWPGDVDFSPPQTGPVGPVLHNPRLVSATFAGTPRAADAAALGSVLCKSNWWQVFGTVVCDGQNPPLCVGACQDVTSVVVDAPLDPTYVTLADADTSGLPVIDTLMQSLIGAGSLPKPGPSDVLVLYLPHGTQLLEKGVARCYAYFSTADPTGATDLVWNVVVVQDCSDELDGAGPLTQLMLHMVSALAGLVSGAPDKYGYPPLDPCSHGGSGPTRVSEAGYSLPRFWSDAASLAGHNPCLPNPETGPYVQMRAGLQGGDIQFDRSGVAHVPLKAFADLPMPEGWHVSTEVIAGEWEDLPVTRLNGQTSLLVHAGDVVDLEIRSLTGPTGALPKHVIDWIFVASTLLDGSEIHDIEFYVDAVIPK